MRISVPEAGRDIVSPLGLSCSQYDGATLGVNLPGLSRRELSLQQTDCQRVLHLALEGSLEGAGAVVGVVTLGGNEISRRVREPQPQPPLGQQLAQSFALKVDDGANVLAGECMEHQDF